MSIYRTRMSKPSIIRTFDARFCQFAGDILLIIPNYLSVNNALNSNDLTQRDATHPFHRKNFLMPFCKRSWKIKVCRMALRCGLDCLAEILPAKFTLLLSLTGCFLFLSPFSPSLSLHFTRSLHPTARWQNDSTYLLVENSCITFY